MILAIPPEHRRQIAPAPTPPPLSPMAPTKSIGSLPLVLTAGESSPTSILVDVTVNCPNGVTELKRIKGYSDQLLLPEAMIYGNDLIKVWSIEDEQQTETSNSFDDTTHQTMIRLQEEPTYNKKSYLSLEDFPKDSTPANEIPTMFPVEEISIFEEEEMGMDMDDLFMALPPSTITLAPRPSPSPLSPPSSPILGRDSIQSHSTFSSGSTRTTLSSGSTRTLVLDNIDNTDELLKPSKPPKGHRRSHRRNNSHFNFQFA